MIGPDFMLEELRRLGIVFYTGVPDSLMKNFLLYLDSQREPVVHMPAANEGGAVALGVGHYLATGKCPLVYMQNSGLGNAVNPLLSLADRQVYSIPVLLLIGWRGEPGVSDEPQHVKQGRITLDLLRAMEIPYEILPADESEAATAIARVYRAAIESSSPAALVARKSTFSGIEGLKQPASRQAMTREEALKLVADSLEDDAVVLSTTGKLSRELYEYRRATGSDRVDFITVGSMGHVSQIALGVARGQTTRPVYCFDGDGSAIMHLGGMTVAGTSGLSNFKHVIFNNGAHDSVGGQSTPGFDIDLAAIAAAARYRETFFADDKEGLEKEIARFKHVRGPALLEIRVGTGSRPDLGRPEEAMSDIKKRFMNRF